MILRISEKTNVNGWRRQLTVDLENKTIKAGAFQFHSGDIEGITHKQYLDFITYFINQGFTETEV